MSSSTFETEEPRQPRRRLMNLTISGGRLSLAGGRLSVGQLIALVTFAAVALALAIVMLGGLAGVGGSAPDAAADAAPETDRSHMTAQSGAVVTGP